MENHGHKPNSRPSNQLPWSKRYDPNRGRLDPTADNASREVSGWSRSTRCRRLHWSMHSSCHSASPTSMPRLGAGGRAPQPGHSEPQELKPHWGTRRRSLGSSPLILRLRRQVQEAPLASPGRHGPPAAHVLGLPLAWAFGSSVISPWPKTQACDTSWAREAGSSLGSRVRYTMIHVYGLESGSATPSFSH